MSGYDRPPAPVEIATVEDENIDLSDIPELDDAFRRHAKLVEPDPIERITRGHASPITPARYRCGRSPRP